MSSVSESEQGSGADTDAADEQGAIETPAAAAGIPAVVEVARQVLDKPGLADGVRGLLKMNQPGGFDCPGCAWPEADKPKAIEFCENGAKAFADEATRKRIDQAFFDRHSISDLRHRSDQWLNAQGRLVEPVVKRPGEDHYTAITWFSAFELIRNELRALAAPDEAAFYTSGRTSNEAAYLWQLFVRMFGTNNMPDCSNMCHESSGTGLTQVIGSGKGTVRLSDFEHADAIFIFGQNPGSNHPRMLATLQNAKKRGAKIVTVNPLNETGLRNFRNPQTVMGLLGQGTDLADLHVPVRINGDVAFIKGVCKAVLEFESRNKGKVLDRDFIAQYTHNVKAFIDDIAATRWADIIAASGVEKELILEAARIYVSSSATICCWAMGLTQHKNAVGNIQEIINLLLLKGNLGKQGAGACPVRGHSNVQGDRTMGIWEKPTAELLDSLRERYGFEPPATHGFDTVETINAIADGRVKVLLAMGGNFMAATPDTAFTAEAVSQCRLTVQMSTKLNRSHVLTGDAALILPVLGRSEVDVQDGVEQFVSIENSMGVVSASRGTLPPASPSLRSEVRVVADLAQAVLRGESKINWNRMANDYQLIRDEIEAAIPGFEEFNDRLLEEGSIELPHPVRDERLFATASGKAEFTVHTFEPLQLGEGQYLMMTIRSHDQFNTTVYTQNDRYRGVTESRRVVFMHPRDIASAGLQAGQRVDITSHFDSTQRSMQDFRIVPYDIPLGCVASYYPETNPLIPVEHVAEGSNTPAYKSIIVSLK